MSPNRSSRRDKFRKLGQAISALRGVRIGDPDANDYFTGKSSKFHISSGATDLRHERDDTGIEGVPFPPGFKTPQWVRTI